LCTLFVAAVMCVVYGICDCCYAVMCVMCECGMLCTRCARAA